MNHSHFTSKYLSGIGVEIGAFKTPIPGIQPIYVDRSHDFGGEKCLVDVIGDAVSLPIFDSSLDYVASSHVLEHVANPIRALVEWQRVTKSGGYVYCVVPNRRVTFDKNRELTPVEHMIQDYHKGIDDTDSTHIEDFVYGIDWSIIRPELSGDEIASEKHSHFRTYMDMVQSGTPINIHFHVFEPDQFKSLIDAATNDDRIDLQFDLVELVPEFPDIDPNGFLAVLKNRKRINPVKKVENFIRSKVQSSFPVK